MSDASQSRAWIFTLNNPSEAEKYQFKNMEVEVSVIGLEGTAEEHTIHLQGYIKFKRAYRLAALKKLNPRAHWEIAKCSDAANYCMKEAVWHHFDGRRSTQGKRRDLEETYECARHCMPRLAFLQRSPGLQSLKLFDAIQCELQPDRHFKPIIIWLWGPSGSGKTRMAYDFHPVEDVAKIGDFDYWFAYRNHPVVIMDEVRQTKISLGKLLVILDRYPHEVRTFYGWRKLNSRIMYVTSPKPPDEQYAGTKEDLTQLLRRLTFVLELGTMPDADCQTMAGLSPSSAPTTTEWCVGD